MRYEVFLKYIKPQTIEKIAISCAKQFYIFYLLLFFTCLGESVYAQTAVKPLSNEQVAAVVSKLDVEQALRFQEAHQQAVELWTNRGEHDFETDLELPPGELEARQLPDSEQLDYILAKLVDRFEQDYLRRYRRQLFRAAKETARTSFEKPDRELLLAAIDQRLQALLAQPISQTELQEIERLMHSRYRGVFCAEHEVRIQELLLLELRFLEASEAAYLQYNQIGAEKFLKKLKEIFAQKIDEKRSIIFDGIERGEYRDEYKGFAVKLTTIGSNGSTQVIGKISLPTKKDAVIALNLPLSINHRILTDDTPQVKKFQMRLAHQEGGPLENSFNVLIVSRLDGRFQALDYLNLPFLISWKRLKLYVKQAVQSGKTADLKLALFFSLPLQLSFLGAGLISESVSLPKALSVLLIKGSYIFFCAQFSDTYERLVRSKNPLVEMTLKSLYVFPMNLLIMMILNGVDKPSTYFISFALSVFEKSASVMMIKWIRFLEEQRRLKGQYHWNFGPFRQPRKVVFWREQMATVRSALAAVGLTKDASTTLEVAGEEIPFPIGIIGLAGVSLGFHQFAEWQARRLSRQYEQKAIETDISTKEGLEKQQSYRELALYFEKQKESLKNVRFIVPGLYPLIENSVRGTARLCQKGLSILGLSSHRKAQKTN